MKKDQILSEHQMEIMRVLWQLGSATVADVHEMLNQTRELALTTVATMLTRLEKRRLVTHKSVGRQYIYSPAVSEHEVRRSMVSELIQRLFHGDAAQLVSHLVNESGISADELQEIQALIEEQDREDQQR